MQTGSPLATAQAVFNDRVAPQQVQRHAANEPQIRRGMMLSGPVGIFAELHVEHPMLAIFDPPMPTHDLGKAREVRERASVIPIFGRAFVTELADRFHPPDGRQTGPLRFLRQPVERLLHRIAPDVDPAVVLLYRLIDR